MSAISTLRLPNELVLQEDELHRLLLNPNCLLTMSILFEKGKLDADQIASFTGLNQEETSSLLQSAVNVRLVATAEGGLF
jgi:hypothetical protein